MKFKCLFVTVCSLFFLASCSTEDLSPVDQATGTYQVSETATTIPGDLSGNVMTDGKANVEITNLNEDSNYVWVKGLAESVYMTMDSKDSWNQISFDMLMGQVNEDGDVISIMDTSTWHHPDKTHCYFRLEKKAKLKIDSDMLRYKDVYLTGVNMRADIELTGSGDEN